MNMGKIRRRAFVLCLLALLFPLAANAVPKIELKGYVTSVSLKNKVGTIEVSVVETGPWTVVINKFTDAAGIDLKNLKIDTLVDIKGVYAEAEGGILALEIAKAEMGDSKIEGTITRFGYDDVYGRYIEIVGHQIPVPEGVAFKDGAENTITFGGLEDLAGLGPLSVKVEGYTDYDYFQVNAVKQIQAFYCANSSTYSTDPQLVLSKADPDITEAKVTTKWCELENGKRTGVTEISEIVYPFDPTDPTAPKSNYTFGKWKDGKPDGYWLAIDVEGKLLRWCRYKRGDLNKKDSWQEESHCPEGPEV
jgi:hypothetical protein